jgi:spermidine synthase
MKPWVLLGKGTAGDGELSLYQRDTELSIRVDGEELMSSRQHGSEERLAELGCKDARGPVLVGGLGMGFTLRAVLDLVPKVQVIVAELAAIVVEWNRGPLAHLAGNPLDDPRVDVRIADVGQVIRDAAPASLDAILLDVDNGPRALVAPDNDSLYGRAGLLAQRRALRPGGMLAVWSAAREHGYASRLVAAGFHHEVHNAAARGKGRGGSTHVIYVARVR